MGREALKKTHDKLTDTEKKERQKHKQGVSESHSGGQKEKEKRCLSGTQSRSWLQQIFCMTCTHVVAMDGPRVFQSFASKLTYKHAYADVARLIQMWHIALVFWCTLLCFCQVCLLVHSSKASWTCIVYMHI